LCCRCASPLCKHEIFTILIIGNTLYTFTFKKGGSKISTKLKVVGNFMAVKFGKVTS
jgi:hypothetical protein